MLGKYVQFRLLGFYISLVERHQFSRGRQKPAAESSVWVSNTVLNKHS